MVEISALRNCLNPHLANNLQGKRGEPVESHTLTLGNVAGNHQMNEYLVR